MKAKIPDNRLLNRPGGNTPSRGQRPLPGSTSARMPSPAAAAIAMPENTSARETMAVRICQPSNHQKTTAMWKKKGLKKVLVP